MTLINHPGHDHQLARAELDAGIAADIVTMLDDIYGMLISLEHREAPAAAAQAAAVLTDIDSLYDLSGLAGAVSEARGHLHRAVRDALDRASEAQLEPERADRRQITTHITSSNGHEPAAAAPPT